MKKTILTIVMATLCLILTAKAQQVINLTGRVITSPESKPLSGATVKIKQGGAGVLSNQQGAFTLQTSLSEGTLVISYTGYQTTEVPFGKAAMGPFEIILHEAQSDLREVEINAGYYTVKDRERTGSISRITAETIGKQPVSNPLLALQGSAAGVYIQQSSGIPGSSVTVQIRGRNSIAAGNDPFYIIDGVPFLSQSLSSVSSSSVIFGTAGSSPLNVLNPNDIESIEILKDADATAIYGSRGANGVVLITTKKGKMGQTTVAADVQSGISKVASKLDMLNTTQYLELRNEALINDGVVAGDADYDLNGTWDKSRYTDWQEHLLGGTAHFNNAQFSLSGGNANTQLLLSGNYQSQSNVFPGDLSYKKYSAHFSGSHSALNQKLKASFSLIYSGDRNDQFYGDLTTNSLNLAPDSPPLYTPEGKINWANSTWINPLRELESDFLASTNMLIGNFTVNYQVMPGLNVKANIGYNDNRLNDHSNYPAAYNDPADNVTTGLADFNYSKVLSWIAEPQIDYKARFGPGKLNATVGATFQQQDKDQLSIRSSGIPSDALIDNIKAGTAISINSYQNISYKYQAVYGRLNYTLLDRYVVNLTGRRDGSSRFGPGKQFANFGAAGLAWIFGNEPWLAKRLPFLSTGKLRLTYGIAGNDQIGDYEFLDVYNSTTAYNGVGGLAAARLFNPDLAWELNKKLELAADLGFIKDRLLLSVSYYRNRSSNQLIQYSLPATTGFTGVRTNFGATVQNSGVELELSSINLKGRDFSWSSSFNLSVPKNKLLEFPGLASSTYAATYEIGQPLSMRKYYKYIGVNPQSGLYEVQDVNGDGSITSAEDRKTKVNIGPRFYGGFRNTFTYKNFQLGFLLHFVDQVVASYFVESGFPAGLAGNIPVAVFENSWHKAGDLAKYQRFTTGSDAAAYNAYNLYAASDAGYQRSYFVRLKNVDLSYEFKAAGKMGIRLFMQGQNLFTVSNYFGLDPETRGANLPPLKTMVIGAHLTF
jgi:TonB-linked SusC/RagA family outer membrane protein